MAEKQKPTIVQFDSEDFYVAVVEQALYDVGLELAGKSKSKPQAEKLLEKIVKKEIPMPDLAIVDSFIENSHEEGRVIATKLRELNPKIKIIAYTIIEDIDWADYVAIKSNRVPDKTLIKGLEQLLNVSFESEKDESFSEYS